MGDRVRVTSIEAEVFKAVDSAQKQIERAGGVRALSLTPLKKIMEEAVETKIKARNHSLKIIANHFVKMVKSSQPWEQTSSSRHIVTLSSSETITQCLRGLIE
jgi:hypothetical protein